MNLPNHLSISIKHNPHKLYYETVEEFLGGGVDEWYEWVSKEDREKCIEKDELWEVMWYPNTPIGYLVLCGSDLQLVLDTIKDRYPINSIAEQLKSI